MAAEAERVRNAENALKRRAADVEILVEESKKKRAAETGNTAALPGAEQQKSLASEPTKCPTPVIQSRPLAGGIAMVEISAPCQVGKPVVIHYEGLASNLTIGTDGNLSAALDLIFGPEPGAMVEIEGFAPAKISLAGLDLDKVSKTAVLWTSPVNVDLHAFEYASIAGAPGHLWQGNPSASADASAQSKADGLGHGFISRSDDGQRAGSKVEVYTFLHSPGQTRGVVTFGLDFESRGATPEGENCGDGSNAQLAFETVVRSPNGSIRRESGIIPSAKCGVPLSAAARRNAGAIPDLRLNR
ncbi:MAG: hypothetical protein HOP09_01135 [Hyphomicrobium sp.]|nr:hypothetical protein [Hyphomicrobium sp.]